MKETKLELAFDNLSQGLDVDGKELNATEILAKVEAETQAYILSIAKGQAAAIQRLQGRRFPG